jgi:arylsulfatase A-like enzyme
MPRLNILYIHSHDTGRYVQPYGHAIATPNIQRLAEQGALFRQAFCANPTCSPSRSALLTGTWPHNNGMIGLAHRGFALNDPAQHLAHVLRETDYDTAMVGQQHLGHYVNGYEQTRELGYDNVLTCEEMNDDSVSRLAEQFIRQSHDRPFFLSVGYSKTHRSFPNPPDPADDARYTLPPAPLPDTPEIRADMAGFKTSARQLDQQMGRVFAALDAAHLADHTLILCTTDHGIAFPLMKCSLTDHGIGVMLIARGPGGFTGGKVIDAMVSQLDIFPTLCELLRITPPPWLAGQSILPLMRGQVDQVHDEIFAEVNFHAAYEPQRCVRTARWKYIRRYDPRSGPVLSNCDDSPSKDVLLRQGWANRPLPAESLYDLTFDPQETNNLADQPQMAGVLQDMRDRLDAWMRRTHDPLLHGPLPLPPGARVNQRDQPSASGPESDVI